MNKQRGQKPWATDITPNFITLCDVIEILITVVNSSFININILLKTMSSKDN